MAAVDRHIPTTIQFYFDFLSPFAYLARHRLSDLARQHDWAVDYIAIDLARAKTAIGNVGPGNRDLPVKLAYIKHDLERWAKLYGIHLVFPPNYHSQKLNTGLYYPQCQGFEADYVRVAFHQVWGLGKAPDSNDVLSTVAFEMGWNPADFLHFVDSEKGQGEYTEATRQAIARNVFGVPTMAVRDEMWWGNDRLFLLEKFLTEETNNE